MENNIYIHGSIPEYENDGDDQDRYYLPARAIAYGLRSTKDAVVIPDQQELNLFVDQFGHMAQEIGLKPPRTIKVPDTHYLLDQAIRNDLNNFRGNFQIAETHNIHPYSSNIFLRKWVAELNDSGYVLRISIPERKYFSDLKDPNHRGGWGRWVDDPETPSFPERHDIPYPTSYIGVGEEQVVEAYQRVSEHTGRSSVFVKPVFGAGGFTIGQADSERELREYYEHIKGRGSLKLFNKEMPIEVQEEIIGIEDLGSTQYKGLRSVTPGGFTRQLVVGHGWAGNVFNSRLAESVNGEANDIFQRFVVGMREEKVDADVCSGGIDFAVCNQRGISSTERNIIVLEHNGAREVGAGPAIALSKVLGVEDKPFLIRKAGDPKCDLETYWRFLRSEGLQYDPQDKEGIVPVVIMEGSGFIFVSGESEAEILRQSDAAIEKSLNLGYVK